MLPLTIRPSASSATIDALVAEGLNPYVAKVLAGRGAIEVKEALGRYDLLPYHELLGIDIIAAHINEAINKSQRITVVADYDCDGATACAVAVSGLRALGAVIDFVVPNRFLHGYGLTPSVVELVLERFADTKWILTVDNGIASNAGVEAAQLRGVGVLVTDHHLPGDVIPPAESIVNPNQPGCTFPSKNLAGCGVMFYVLAATRDLRRKSGDARAEKLNLAEFLDVVALGTVADVVRLDANNRWLVRRGLRRIRQGLMRPGIRALFVAAKRDPAFASSQDFGFGLGPRLNAAGRIDDMTVGIRTLLEPDYEKALALASQLDTLNTSRRAIETNMKELSEGAVLSAQQAGRFTRVVYGNSFHEGVVGIVAGRIKESDHVPTIVFAPATEAGMIKGSGRSIPGVHLRDALDLVHKRGHNLIPKFGGHAMAAGLTLPKESLEDFKRLFEEIVRELLCGQLPQAELKVDGALPLDALSLDTAIAFEGEVWGQGWEEPVWTGVFDVIEARLVGKDQNHVQLKLDPGDGITVSAMHFFSSELPESGRITAAYKLSVNRFRGQDTLTLLVVDREDI
jgi:single-stranded-DNA-specific exonuclease